ncbi:MAG: Omp28-related outer membrane protein [Prevotella sp.]|nr:Omp28-related outer membrane protein [Prevotella sp.]
MLKLFTVSAALVLSLTIANAQTRGSEIMKPSGEKAMKRQDRGSRSLAPKKAGTVPSKIALESDEHLVGFYTTDDLPDLSSGEGYIGMYSNPGQLKAGVIFEDDVLKKRVGGQITKVRFALAVPVDVANVEVRTCTPNYYISDQPIASADLSTTTTQIGWNEATLSTPVTIEDGMYYLVSFEYTQSADPNEPAAWPLVTDMEVKTDITPEYGFLLYGYWPQYGVTDWFTMGSDYGNLCIQAVVKGGSSVDDDIVLKNLVMDKYASKGDELAYSFNIKSDGNAIPSAYVLNITVDGTVVQTLDTPIALTSGSQKYSGRLALPADLSLGSHNFAVSVATINGKVPTQNIDDDTLEAAFTVYEGSATRQMHLIENYTSVQCTYCPLGHDLLEKLQEMYPSKYAWVAIHGAGMGADPFYLTDGSSDFIEYFSMPVGSAYPSAGFDRYILDDDVLNEYGTIGIGLGYSSYYQTTAATMIDDIVTQTYSKIPAFVNVNIATTYDDATKELTIRVFGDGVNGAQQLLDGNRLTVYLTEDGLVSTQYNNGKYDPDYVHNNVLRKIINQYAWGDEVNWTSDSSYENDFTVKLDNTWNAANMHVVAFISGSYAVWKNGDWYYGDFGEAYVNNANMAKVGGSSDIRATVSDTDVTETSRYAVDGRQLSTPVKGLNIVKMSDGTTRKVIVR